MNENHWSTLITNVSLGMGKKNWMYGEKVPEIIDWKFRATHRQTIFAAISDNEPISQEVTSQNQVFQLDAF